MYTVNSQEFGKSCGDLSWNHCTSTPHRSEINWIAERAMRRIEEWTSAGLLQSGLDETWWAHSMECGCYLRNIQGLLSKWKTPCERRFGVPFLGPIIPFRAMVLLKTCRDCIRSARKSYQVYSLVMGYTPEESGKETFWSQTLRKWKRWTHLKSMLKDWMRSRRWNSQTLWRRSGSENIHLNPGSPRPRRSSRRPSWRIRRVFFKPLLKTHRCLMVKQEMISGLFQGTFFTVIT